MKEWWMNLAAREKQIVLLGAILLTLFFFYLFIWSPLTEKVSFLRTQIERNQNLLGWMEESRTRIKELESNPQSEHVRSGSLLGIVQDELKSSGLVKNANGQFKQTDNNTVQINFEKVSFDTLISWLTQVWEKDGLIMSQLNVTPSSQRQGIVTAEVVLTRG